MNEIKIEYYSKKWEVAHMNFAKQYWKKRRRFTPKYIYWKFRGDKNSCLKSFLLAVSDNRVIGQIGMIPCEAIIDGKSVNAQWICDLMIDNEFRGKNIAAKLYEKIESNGRYVLGSDPSPSAKKSLIKNGYSIYPGPWVMLFPLSIGGTLSIKLPFFSSLSFIINPVYVVVKMFLNRWLEGCYEVSFDHSDWNHLQENKNIKGYVKRSDAYLEWRLSKFDDFYSGIRIVRKIGSSAFMYFYEGSGCMYVADYRYENIKELACLLTYIGTHARKKQLDFIKIMANNDNEVRDLSLLLSIKMRTRTEIVMKANPSRVQDVLLPFYYTLMDSDENI